MAAVAPEKSEEMERMVAPPIVANLTFGGMVLVADMGGHETGLMCNPMGMITPKMCCLQCLGCPQYDFTYVDGAYQKAISIETKPGSKCTCMQPHYAASLKDYTADKMKPTRTVVGVTRKKGQPEGGCKQKSYKQTCGFYAQFGVKDGQATQNDAFYIKNRVSCLKCLTCPECDNCSKGVTKGKFCMNYRVPIYNPQKQVVAYVVQTVPLIPTSCCAATAGPTLQMSIHKADPTTTFSDEDVARLSLFLFTVQPAVPGGGMGGGVYFINKIINQFLYTTGWALGARMNDVTQEYLTPREVFNGEIAGFGDILDKIRGK